MGKGYEGKNVVQCGQLRKSVPLLTSLHQFLDQIETSDQDEQPMRTYSVLDSKPHVGYIKSRNHYLATEEPESSIYFNPYVDTQRE